MCCPACEKQAANFYQRIVDIPEFARISYFRAKLSLLVNIVPGDPWAEPPDATPSAPGAREGGADAFEAPLFLGHRIESSLDLQGAII